MAIHRLLKKPGFGPEDIQCLVATYEKTLRTLSLTKRDDPLTELIVQTIIRVGQTGVHDPARISELAIKQLNCHKPPLQNRDRHSGKP